jgi:radical SAM superfamily enzyme YgiQ (UPF0313 family)
MSETATARPRGRSQDADAVDVVLLKMPNHNMDYPHLATPTLTAALRKRFYRVVQKDVNVLLRDRLLTADLLGELTHAYLPAIGAATVDTPADFERIRNAVTYLRFIEDTLGFDKIEEIKERMQARDYDALFSDETDASIVSLVFVLTGLLHAIIDIGLIYEDADLPVRNPITDFLDAMADQIAAMRPRVVGFSVIQIQRRATLMFARRLKARTDATIVVGGPDVSTFKEEYLNADSSIDAAFLKEAETTFTKFLEGAALEDIKGIVFRAEDGSIRTNEADYDRAQSVFKPDFDGYDLDKFLLPTLPLSTSRGCAFAKCTFCNHYKTYSGYYSNDAKTTVDILEHLQTRYGTRFFHFVDDMLEVHEGTAIANELLRRGLDVNILTYARFEPEFRDPEILDLWSRAGIRVIEWGLESASQKVLKKMIKGVSIKQVQNILNISTDSGIVNKLMLFHNYPGEEVDDLKQTVDFLRRNTLDKKVRPFFTVRGKLELRLFTPLEVDSRDYGQSPFRKRYERSSTFDSLLGYADSDDYADKAAYIEAFIDEMSGYLSENRIFSTNDENMSLDLIVLDMQRRAVTPAVRVQ